MGLLSTIGAASGRAFGFTRSAIAAATDAFFNRVTLLLPGNGTNGAQNNTFLDSSTNNFTITRNGNTTQGTFSPFSQTGWSNYFDGSGDFLSWNSGSSVAFGTSDFTVEAFVYVTSTPNTKYIIDARDSSNTGAWAFAFGLGGTGYKLGFFDGTTTIEEATASIPNNSWQHCVAVRSGTRLSVYLNGSRVATDSNNTKNLNVSPTTSYIGTRYTGSGYDLEGYISNVRIIKGTAAYDPTQTTITVPTAPLTDVANTVLLTCASNRFFDKNTQATAKTITVNGTPSVQAFSPFNPTAEYSAATVGGSGYFDGTGDNISAPSNAAFAFGTGDFTVEAWVYITVATGTTVGFWQNGTSDSCNLQRSTAGNLQGWDGAERNTTTPVPSNTWHHVVFTRVGTTARLFLNGVQATSWTSNVNYGNSGWVFGYTAGGTNTMTGYIAGARILKGTGYTSITVPTEPPTAITNTSLLLNYTNAGITDATAKNVLETVGNAQISTTQSKFGGSSMYFDGNGDYLIPNAGTTDLFAFGSGDFTVEMWIYQIGTGILTLYDTRPNNTNGAYFNIASNSQQLEVYVNTTTILQAGSISLNTWTHIAVSRSGTSLRGFINGTQVGSTVTNSTVFLGSAQRPVIGASGFNVTNFNFNGYIDDLRVTKGYARYTANFTAPTSAFALQ